MSSFIRVEGISVKSLPLKSIGLGSCWRAVFKSSSLFVANGLKIIRLLEILQESMKATVLGGERKQS